MKFGIMNLFPADGEDDHQVLRETIEEIQLADDLGFDSCWLAEHHFSRYGILGNPLILATIIAERTKRIKIGTAVIVVPFHHPMRLAEDAAVLDILSDGRLLLGLGRGYQPREFAGFGQDPADKRTYYAETVDLLHLAWNEHDWSYHGQHFDYENMTVYPRPRTPGGPPILHATSSPEAFTEAGENGKGIIVSSTFTPMVRMKQNFELYHEGLAQGGHNSAAFDLPFMQQVWCGPSETGLEAAAEAALAYYQSVGKVIPGSDEAMESERRYYEAVHRNIGLLTIEKTLTHGGNFGSVDRVVETIGRLRDDLGITHFIGWFHIPSLERRLVLESMDRFASEVMPQLRGDEVDTDSVGVPAHSGSME